MNITEFVSDSKYQKEKASENKYFQSTSSHQKHQIFLQKYLKKHKDLQLSKKYEGENHTSEFKDKFQNKFGNYPYFDGTISLAKKMNFNINKQKINGYKDEPLKSQF